MAGLEKIESRIMDEANETARQTTDEARAEAAKIVSAAKEEAAKVSAGILERSGAELAGCREKNASSIDLQKRNRLLAAKQELIGEFLEKAYASLDGMEDAAYFDFLLKLVKQYAQPKEGRIRFNERDLKRLPMGYELKISEAARGKGGSLSVSHESVRIDNGFVLDYGGIEENCTFRALFEEKKDTLSDTIRGLLFA